jgi:hypothetical protein
MCTAVSTGEPWQCTPLSLMDQVLSLGAEDEALRATHHKTVDSMTVEGIVRPH